MMSRDKILSAIKQNQPALVELPLINFQQPLEDNVSKFVQVLQTIGGNIFEINSMEEAAVKLKELFPGAGRMVTVDETFSQVAELYQSGHDAHLLEDVDVAVINAPFAVAENGSVFITEEIIKERVLPFICQHLVVILNSKNVLATMHDAYDKIGNADYGFTTFIAGPSKTADIEQSLVLGAHGPKTMTVFIVDREG